MYKDKAQNSNDQDAEYCFSFGCRKGKYSPKICLNFQENNFQPANERVSSISRRHKSRREIENKKQRSQDSDTSNAGINHNSTEKHSRQHSSSSSTFQEALKPLIEEQRLMSDRIGKLNHSIEVCLYQQKERDNNSNINRDLVLLIILVVMIQAVLNWVLTERANKNL